MTSGILQILTKSRWHPATYIVYSIANSQQVHLQETYVETLYFIRKASHQLNITRPTTHQKGHLHVKVASRAFPFLLHAPTHNALLGPQPGPRKGEKKPVYVLNITIPPILVDNYVEPSKSAVNIQVSPPSCLKGLRETDRTTQNHAILHSFLSSLVEEFLVRYSFLKPPPQVQPWEESGRTPRKRRKLAGHTVSVYSPGPSQQSHRAAEWDYLPPELELLRSCCSDCSGSCDGCSSCCDGCLYAHEGSDSDPDLPEDTCYSEGQLDLGEYSLSDEVFDTQVSLKFHR